MSDRERLEPTELFSLLAKVKAPEAKSEQALAKSRSYVAQTAAVSSPALPLSPSPRHRFVLPVLSGLAACLVVAFAAWLFFYESAGTAFAKVQERVAQTKSVEFVSFYENEPEQKILVRALESGPYRQEETNGTYSVGDPASRRLLVVGDPQRQAILIRGYEHHLRETFYQQLSRFKGSLVEALPARRIDGKTCHGYQTRLKLSFLEEEFTVWSDQETLLPFRIESALFRRGKFEDRLIFANIRFDQEYESTLFELVPPTGYKVAIVGQDSLPEPPSDIVLIAPELKPGIGLGDVRFGMSREQVLDILGSPDPLGSEAMGNLSYLSRGYTVNFDESTHVRSFECYAAEVADLTVRPFAGQTTAGIRLGSGRKEMEAAYGQPDEVEERGNMSKVIFHRLGLHLTLLQGRVVRITMEKPGVAKSVKKESLEYYFWTESQPERKSLVRILEPGIIRRELPKERYQVVDVGRQLMLEVDTRKEKARLFRGFVERLPKDLNELLRSLPVNATPVSPRSIDGRMVDGYRGRLQIDEKLVEEVTIWVDRESGLPIRVESDPYRNGEDKDRWIMSAIRFDADFDPRQFAFEPPSSYSFKLVGVEELTDPPTDPKLRAPELKPGVGMGEARFGMSREEVVTVLGKPEDEQSSKLDYPSRGYAVSVHPDRGVDRFTCFAQEGSTLKVHSFGGKTTVGIGIGSSQEAVEAAYGTPAQVFDCAKLRALFYHDLGLSVLLLDDQAVLIVVEKPITPKN